jgi:hypothetical protein
MRAILAGQLEGAQVTDACVTVYGTDAQVFDSLPVDHAKGGSAADLDWQQAGRPRCADRPAL